MTRTCLRLASIGALTLSLAMTARATIDVDPAAGGDFTTLEAAIAAAAGGEQILVKSGTYLPSSGTVLLLDGKGLSIVAEAGATVVLPGLHVTHVPPGHWVVLRGLTLDGTLAGAFQTATALRVDGPASSVWVEECTLRGSDGSADPFFFLPTAPGLGVLAQAEASVTLQRCTVQGGRGWNATGGIQKWFPGNGAPGVAALDSSVALHGCTVTGGDIGPGDSTQFGNPFFSPLGGAGLEVSNSGFAHVAGSTLTGGATGTNVKIDDDESGDGVLMYGSATSLWVRDSVLQPGPIVNVGIPGLPIDGPASAVTTFGAPARSLQVTSPLREGQMGTLSVQGEQGDLVVLLVALGAGFTKHSGKQGVLSLDPSVLLLPVALGAIGDPGGTFAMSFVTPDLNPQLLGLTVPLQLAVVNGGVATLEAGSALAWLDSSL